MVMRIVGDGFLRWVLRSKIHKATVTDANPDYVGSIGVDEDLIMKAGFWPGEKVLVVSNTSGVRLETYLIPCEKGSGKICMNGAAAHKIKPGEEITIMGFELTDVPIEPKKILVNKQNKPIKFL